MEAVASCIAQSYRPVEIVVGDDSRDSSVDQLLAEEFRESRSLIRYFHNSPSKGQAHNVNSLFDRAAGSRVVLLHDDDLLLPNALSTLDSAWRKAGSPQAVFGKQYIISESGERLLRESEMLNDTYYRGKDATRLQLRPLESALVQQFPNNGYLIHTELARRVRYKDEKELGTTRWCDFEFSLRFAEVSSQFVFIDEFTACYRLSPDAVSKRGRPTYMYPLISSMELPSECEWAREVALRRLAPIVTANYSANGKALQALQVYFSRYYGWRLRMTSRGIYHLVRIAMAFLRSKHT
jgi:glycosyltransferase involved in cell wall biosynthesis